MLARKLGNGVHVHWFNRGVRHVLAKELTDFNRAHGAAKSPHFPANLRWPSTPIFHSTVRLCAGETARVFRFDPSQIQNFANQYVNWYPVRVKIWSSGYEVKEENNAHYFMTEFETDEFTGNIGVRSQPLAQSALARIGKRCT
jgi:hypothetical protein